MSRTSRGVQAREATQIIMQSPASLASSSSTESRWSGIPSRTGVSQVPQVPSPQDAGLLDRVEDGRVRWDGQGKFALGEVDLERIVPYGFGGWFGEEPLDVQ
jgi:hypothetical protein